jgi:formyltetrahydrofolate hydrolase
MCLLPKIQSRRRNKTTGFTENGTILTFIVLARYMQIITKLIAQYKNQIINIHHSFLQRFLGQNRIIPLLNV